MAENAAPEVALAVVGMAGRFPGARDVDELWQMLCAGREGVRFFCHEELDPSIPDAVRRDPLYVRAKGIIDDCDKFDAAFFGITPLEAQVMDPQQRIALELSWAALESAGHVADRSATLVGVYLGMNWNRYRAHCVSARPDIVAKFGDLNTALANEYDFLATRISYKLNLRGPSTTVSTACSTSLVAIAQASQALLNYECDIALAGGVSVSVPVNAGYMYQEGGMLSKDGHCRTFDEGSTGTTFNDGAGVVVLRRLEDAVADGDRIYAVVRGFAVNNDGADKVSFTAPSVGGQVEVIKSALDHAGLDPATIGYVETHGTATPLGDPIEIAALKKAFARVPRDRKSCAVGSIKSAVGHLVHAAGVAGFIKAVLAVYHGKLPPSLFFENPNPRLGLDDSPFYVNNSLKDWPAANHPRRAGVSAFGVGGTNAHVVIEQHTDELPLAADASARVLCVSAKSKEALAAQVALLASHFGAANVSERLVDTAFTLQSGRQEMKHRVAVVARNRAEAQTALADKRQQLYGFSEGDARIGFIFTGQGSQRAGMGRWLREHNPVFRSHFDKGADFLKSRVGLDLCAVLFGDSPTAERDVEQTAVAQPALFLLEYSLARTLESVGVTASVLLGHSVGEFVAAALAGVFTFEDALLLVARRGAAMQRMPKGNMFAVYCAESEIASLLGRGVDLAAVNAAELCVLAGPDGAIESVTAALDARGIRHKRLRTSHAFHSSMMDEAVVEFAGAFAEVRLSPPKRLIVSTVTGAVLDETTALNPAYWASQLRASVRFAAALECVANLGRWALVEVGPGTTLTTLASQHKRADRWQARPALPGSGLDAAAEVEIAHVMAACWAEGAPVDWQGYWRDVPVRRVPLPTYAFAKTRYWLDPPLAAPTASVANSVSGPAPTAEPTPLTQPSADGPQPIVTNRESTSMSDAAGLKALEQRVVNVLEDTSGYDLVDADRSAGFSEIGFDSLLLTQVSTSLKQEFGVNVTFRALMEDCTSIDALVQRVAQEVPMNTTPSDVAPAVAPVAADAPVPMRMQPVQPSLAVAPSQGALPADVRGLIEQQLAIMQMQLQALGAAGARIAPAPAQPAMVAAAAPQPAAVSQSVAVATAPAAAEAAPAPRKHTPGTRIEKSKTSKQLTRSQQTYVDKLISNYAGATAGSKRLAQQHRKRMADPRTVSGFNPSWKEMVYPIVTNRSKGSKIWDVDGREYIDLTNGFGPIFFGHSPDFVTRAVLKQIAEGIETGPQSPLAGEVAELFCEITCNERVAYANTGSEAVLAALRLARTVTGRNKVVIFEGAYHGIFDEVVVRPGKNGAGLPAAPGIPREMTSNIIVLPYGTDESLAHIRTMAKDLAAVLVETVQSRHPGLQPLDFLKQIRQITADSGSALIFDEVVTGFRVHPGGAQALFGIRADMAVYGKVVAGGYPIGLIGGKARFLDALDGGHWRFGDDSIPEVGVTFFAGAFVRHPVALAATKAVLEKLKEDGPEPHLNLGRRTTAMANELRGFLKEIDAGVTIEEFSSYFYIAASPDEPYGGLLFYLLRLGGIHTWEFRPCFLTLSHTEKDVETFKRVFKDSVAELVRQGLLKGNAVALERLSKGKSQPPVEGARLGKDKDGIPAWFVPDPDRPGKFIQVDARKIS